MSFAEVPNPSLYSVIGQRDASKILYAYFTQHYSRHFHCASLHQSFSDCVRLFCCAMSS